MGKAWATLEEKLASALEQNRILKEIVKTQEAEIERLEAENVVFRNKIKGATPQDRNLPEEIPIDDLSGLLADRYGS